MTRAYRSQQQVRRTVIDHAVDVVIADGLADGPPALARVLQHIEQSGEPRVTKGSVIGESRLWRSQREFQLELEAAVIQRWAAKETVGPLVRAEFRRVLAESDLRTLAGREQALAELIRSVANLAWRLNNEDPYWRLVVALWGRVATCPPGGPEHQLAPTLTEAIEVLREGNLNGVFGPAWRIVGARPRLPGVSAEEASRRLVIALTALGQGLAQQAAFTEPDGDLMLPSGPGGEPRPWTSFAIAAHSLIRGYFELDPDFVRNAASEPSIPD